MNYFGTDHLIVYGFLLITLVIGLRAGTGIKDIREYATANKQFGTGVLTITFLATYLGGNSVIGTTENVFKDGVIPIITTAITPVICILWIALLIVPRMIHFEGCLTMGDIMGTLYGKHGQVATGVLGCLFTTCIVGAQIQALTYVYEFLLGLKSYWAVGLGGLIVIIYASIGGMRAVTITDVLQFVALTIVIPMIANVMINEVGSIKELLSRVPAGKLQMAGHAKLGYYTSIGLFLCVFSPYLLSPPFVARILMARDKKQATHMLFMGGAFLVFFFFLIMLIGLSAFVLYPTIAPDKIIPHVVNALFPVGLRGLCAAGLIAVIMSTADSCLHAAGLSVVHDVIQPLRIAKLQELRWVQYCTFGIGCAAAVLIALRTFSIFGIAIYGMGMMGATITVPFVAGVLGLKTSPKSFKIALWVTIPVFIAANLGFSIESHHWAYPVSLIVNSLVFLGTHVIQNKGFTIERRTNKQHVLWRPTRSRWHTWLPTPQKLVEYSQHKIANYGESSTLFALFLLLNYMAPFFMYSYANPATYGWILAIKSMSILLCLGLLLKPYWSSKYLSYFPVYYHLTLLYCLPFVTTFLFLLEERNIEWVVNVALSILFLIVLVDWVTFLALSVLGVLLALGLYKLVIDAAFMHVDLDAQYTLTYAVIFSTLIGLLFARRKQRIFDTLATQRKQLAHDNQEAKNELLSATGESMRFVSLLKKAGIEQLGSVAHLSKELLETSKKEGRDDFTTSLQKLTDQLIPMALHLDKFSHRTTGFLLLEGVKKIPTDTFLKVVQQTLYDKGHRFAIAIRTQYKELQCDVEKMTKVLVNSFGLVRSVAGENVPLLLGVEDTRLGYPIATVEETHTKQVASLRFTITSAAALPTLEKLYHAQVNEEMLVMPAETSGLPLFANERIVKAHYGYSSTTSMDKDLTLVYIIPVNVREVRSEEMDTPQMQLGASWSRADDSYPGAQEQEQAFLRAIKKKSKADLSLVAKAIDLIKDYHGPVMRQSGEPFYLHPIAVAQIVMDYNTEEVTILSALLHDTVEDTPLTLEQITLLFNKEVSDMVDGVTHMESNTETLYKVLLSHPENIHRLLGAEDKRVLYVKLADRVHNLRTIEAKSHESQRRTAEETLLFFVPLAKYLGLTEAAEELKHRSFEVLGK
jgi:Na+/proline symporter